MFFVYVLRSLKDGKYYFGQTNNLKKRLERHNSGQVLSTKYRRPLILVGYKEFNTRNDARWFEYMLKKHGDRKKKLIKELTGNVNGFGGQKRRPPARRAKAQRATARRGVIINV